MTITGYLCGIFLVGLRVGGLFIFAPVFSSSALPARVKAALMISMTAAIGPMVVARTPGNINLDLLSVARECAISLVFGVSISLIMELANTAGQIVGMQFSFTLVNLLDPNSSVDTPLFSQMFQLLTTTILVCSGFDRAVVASLLRTFVAVPLGGFPYHNQSLMLVIPLTGAVLMASLQLAAPLVAATVLVELSIVVLSRVSPQLPVIALTIPAKTLVGFVVLAASLSTWMFFIEDRFTWLLDIAQSRATQVFGG